MAFDAEPGGDPRGPWCPKCRRPIQAGDNATIMHFAEDPYGHRGFSGRRWHSECALPSWDRGGEALRRLMSGGGF